MRRLFRQKRQAAAGTEAILDIRAFDEPIPAYASVEERAVVGAARVAAYADRPGTTDRRVDDVFSDELGVPEIDARNLSAACLASALHHHGSLVVRELLDDEMVTAVRTHLHPAALRIVGLPVSATIDAMVSTLASAYETSGLLRVVRDYLEEPPVAGAERIVVRRESAGDGGIGWHQDGQFYGIIAALNVWTALDDCGVDRPSLNFVPRRVDHIVTPKQTGLELLKSDTTIVGAVSELLADRPFVEPAMRAGDALLFDEMTVHRTGTRGWSVPNRDLAITWFFAPSRFPDRLTPLAF